MSSSVMVITDNQFESEVKQATTPVLIYFWASWCGPCRLVSPAIDWAATHYGDRLKVFKIEVDPNPLAVKQYKVEGVPALRLLKDHEVVSAYEGGITKQKLAEMLDSHL